MIHIDFTKLNEFEKQIHQTLLEECKNTVTLKISDAAILCGCSVSKISKISKKIGFTNFKQYVEFLHKRDTLKTNESNEFSKIQEFINTFDESRVDEITKDIDVLGVNHLEEEFEATEKYCPDIKKNNKKEEEEED